MAVEPLRPARPVIFLDANVLFSACCRDLLLELSLAGLCECRWSLAVLAETRRALTRQRPDLPASSLDRLIDLMNAAVPSALQTYPTSIPRTAKHWAHPKDLHVLQAAFHAHADMLLTFNLRHFRIPPRTQTGLQIASPDHWLTESFRTHPALANAALESCRRRLRRPALSRKAHLKAMRSAGLLELADHLSQYPPGER